jgi:peptidyl-prolyl cis-trans isomerase B (cyclophilin B)
VPKSTKRERQRINRELRREAMRKAEQRSRRLRTARNIGLLLIPVVILFAVLQITSGGGEESSASIKRHYKAAPPMTIDTSKTYTANMDTSEGKMTVTLDAVNCPVSVNNFVFLAQNRFYDGLQFVRVAKDFVIQAGSPTNTAAGGPGYTVQGEVPKPAEGQPAYPVGALAMAKSGSEPAGTAGSQFFIVTGSQNVNLTPDYACVGTVTAGMDVADKIAQLYPPDPPNDGKPTKTVTIKTLGIVAAGISSTTTTSKP